VFTGTKRSSLKTSAVAGVEVLVLGLFGLFAAPAPVMATARFPVWVKDLSETGSETFLAIPPPPFTFPPLLAFSEKEVFLFFSLLRAAPAEEF
jgi:hypothetical protein